MQIAVTSQNFRSVTGHAGKTRRFLVYDVDDEAVWEIDRLDLPKELSFHEFTGLEHPIDGVRVIVTASCGEGFVRKMAHRGIAVFKTEMADPASAAAAAYAWASEQPAPAAAP
jgi:predicted Fe-Mo cluster-binding NifX family protein